MKLSGVLFSSCVRFAGVAVAVVILAGCAAGPEMELPPDDYDRQAVWQAHMVPCLQGEGWDVSAAEDGSLALAGGRMNESQMDRYAASLNSCEDSSGLPTWDDLSEGQRRGNYQLMLNAAECLSELGYEIRSEPFFQQYEESRASWTPYADLDVDVAEFEKIEKACPQPMGW